MQWKALLAEYAQVEFETLLNTSDSRKRIGIQDASHEKR